ncbi:uncharacterized protein LOC112569193 [Pomacea canaliculata]|uniref:uncharacterized protein LOC112569193 n=1 Tax=Pomacea canaliculata TaxID=400727 RepID=UPI000D739735|nr:uncharacterized protein LOC112569193 [Pomacea canaliculata]
MDIEAFKAQGESIGLTGEALTKYLIQRIEKYEKAEREERLERERNEREERRAKEQAEREERLEKEKIQREREKEQAEREEREREREREFELARLRLGNGQPNGEAQVREVTPKGFIPKLPLFKEDLDDIDSFLFRFEAHAEALRWPRHLWPLHLSATIQGEALKLYHALCAQGQVAYEELRKQLLLKFQCTEDGFREKLRSVRPAEGESMPAFLTRVTSLLDRWITLAGIDKSFESLRDLVLREQIMQSISKDMAVFLKERDPKSAAEMIESAEKYRKAHPGKNIARRQETTMFANASCTTPRTARPQGTTNRPTPPSTYSHRTPPVDNRSRPSTNSPPVHRRPWSEQKRTVSPNQSKPDSVKPSTRLQCFTCQGYGHKARFCANNRQRAQPASVCDVKQEVANVAVLCSTTTQEAGSLPLYPGMVKGKAVQVLRDTGATTAGIRASLVAPSEYLGKNQTCLTFGGRKEVFPLARVQVDTPFFTGPLTCCVIKNPVTDVIIGNIPGVQEVTFTAEYQPVSTSAAVVTRARAREANQAPALLSPALPAVGISKSELIQKQREDHTLTPYFTKTDWLNSSFKVEKGIWYRHFQRPQQSDVTQIVVPQALRSTVLEYAHDSPFAGHQGTRNTLERVFSHFWWPGIRRDVRQYCQTCDIYKKTSAKGRKLG